MDYKKSKAPVNTETRNIMDLKKTQATYTRQWPLSENAQTRFLPR